MVFVFDWILGREERSALGPRPRATRRGQHRGNHGEKERHQARLEGSRSVFVDFGIGSQTTGLTRRRLGGGSGEGEDGAEHIRGRWAWSPVRKRRLGSEGSAERPHVLYIKDRTRSTLRTPIPSHRPRQRTTYCDLRPATCTRRTTQHTQPQRWSDSQVTNRLTPHPPWSTPCTPGETPTPNSPTSWLAATLAGGEATSVNSTWSL